MHQKKCPTKEELFENNVQNKLEFLSLEHEILIKKNQIQYFTESDPLQMKCFNF